MIEFNRRDLLMGGLLFSAFSASEWLRPRETLNLLGDKDLESLLPRAFGSWSSQYDPSLVVPEREGSLADTLYSTLVTRRYVNAESGEELYLLTAYGANQTDALQLHRPEACYPAVGLPIQQREETVLALPSDRKIPTVELQAAGGGRVEDIVYWTRMGNEFPQSAGNQRSVKLGLAMQGLIPDGILVRASIIRRSDQPGFDTIKLFLGGLIAATNAEDGAACIGEG